MATIDLTDIIIPTPAAYNEDHPFQQAENLAYVKLQIYAKMQAAGWTLTDQPATVGGNTIDLSELTQAVKDLRSNGDVFDFGEFLYEKHFNTYSIEDW